MRAWKKTLAATGTAGSATGSVTFYFGTPVRLYGVVLDYTGQPATADVTLANLNRTFTLKTNSGTDTAVLPREQTQDQAGAAVAAGDGPRYDYPVLFDLVTVTLAQGDAADPALGVTLLVD